MPILRLQAPHLDADDILAGKSSLSSSHTDIILSLSVVLSADTKLCMLDTVATVADMVAMAAMAATVVATVKVMAAMEAGAAMVATEATVVDMAAGAAMEAGAAMVATVVVMAAMVTAGEHRSISLNVFCDKENFSICLLRKETS